MHTSLPGGRALWETSDPGCLIVPTCWVSDETGLQHEYQDVLARRTRKLYRNRDAGSWPFARLPDGHLAFRIPLY